MFIKNYKLNFADKTVKDECQCGFSANGFSVLTTFLLMIEKCSKSLDQSVNSGAILAEIIKAFPCLSHYLATNS